MQKRLRSLLAKAQSLTGTTRSELLVVLVILTGLLAGAVGRRFFAPAPSIQTERSEILRLSDSLAAAEMTTFTGTTPDGAPVEELAKADTIVKKPTSYPSRPKAPKITQGKIHLNTATLQDLMLLPGVGEATAEKILALRAERTFTRIEDIMRVKGIGIKKFEAMKPFLDL
jgi:competence ComEA-like helix-hairpin-helix protein